MTGYTVVIDTKALQIKGHIYIHSEEKLPL